MDIVINRKLVSIPLLPIITFVLLVVMAAMTLKVGRIQPDEIGVFVHNLSGEISVDNQPGAKIYNGWLTDFYVVDNVEQSYEMSAASGRNDPVRVKTRDGADVRLDVTINYQLTSDIETIKNKIIPECGLGKEATSVISQGGRRVIDMDAYKLKWIRDYSRSVIRYKFGELIPKEFYDGAQREAKARESQDELNALLNNRENDLHNHGIEVTQVVPGEYHFYQEYEEIIIDTKAAEQDQRTQESEAEAALEEQKREETKALANKTVAITGIEGDLRRAILQEEAAAERATKAAEAYAYATKTQADAEFYRAQNEAKSILATAEAEAEGMRQLAESLVGEGGANLVKLAYAEALKKATITGVPYATDPRIQRVDINAEGTSAAPVIKLPEIRR